MPTGFGTASVAFAAGPTIVSTFFQHAVTWPTRRTSRHNDSTSAAPTSISTLPGNQLRYDEGLNIVRRFLEFASQHGVEEVQGFTAQTVPVPNWIKREVVTIPHEHIAKAAAVLTKHLATYADGKGLELVGGDKWWRVRGRELEGEWIEMHKNYTRRTAAARKESKDDLRKTWRLSSIRRPKTVRDDSGGDVVGDRVIMYIHGGAFFFSSLDLHRYQIQRHARKAGARAFVPNYRLSPQYPFPCGLLDCLTAYMYLLNPPDGAHDPIAPENIILMGDSAGGGMCLSLLIIIREMGLPMPAAASLVSPWVDLTHSMPSIMEWDGGDYIPSVGFHYKPSRVWPPIPGDGVKIVDADGIEKVVDDQIQLYCSNKLLSHPLVSPINAGSLGGLCPMYISAGSAELLRDEIIYVAHKAAAPTTYPPAAATLEEYPELRPLIDKYPPTKVQLQVFEGACHVATTLSWTRSAKHIFRGTANFNIWAFNTAAKQAEVRRHSTSASVPVNGAMPPAPDKFRQVASAANLTAEPQSMMTTPSSSALHTPHHSSTDIPELAMSKAANTSPAIRVGQDESRRNSESSDVTTTTSGSDSEDTSRFPSRIGSALPSRANTAPSSGTNTPLRLLGLRRDTTVISVRGVAPPWGASPIVAERVSIHGKISPFEPISEVPALNPILAPLVGRIRSEGPLKTWIAKRAEWDKKFAKDLKYWRDVRTADRETAQTTGFLTKTLRGEQPPLCALAGLSDPEMARKVGRSVDEPTTKTSVPVLIWMKMGESADAKHEEKGNTSPSKLGAMLDRVLTREKSRDGDKSPREGKRSRSLSRSFSRSRSRSQRRASEAAKEKRKDSDVAKAKGPAGDVAEDKVETSDGVKAKEEGSDVTEERVAGDVGKAKEAVDVAEEKDTSITPNAKAEASDVAQEKREASPRPPPVRDETDDVGTLKGDQAT